MATKLGTIEISRITGRNGGDAPTLIPDDQCVEAINIDFAYAGLGRKIPGALARTVTGTVPHVGGMAVHQTLDPLLPELFMVESDGAKRIVREAAGTATPITPGDSVTGTKIRCASLNGKAFLAYQTASPDRLHVWDGSALRRVGIAAPDSAPTAADILAPGGTYAAKKRYYRQRDVAQADGVTVRRSEPGASVEITPSGTGSGIRVTRHAPDPLEPTTHWELWVSLDNAQFYLLATLPQATTTYDDTTATTAYSAGMVDFDLGTYSLFPAARCIMADDNRILTAGSFGSSEPTEGSRVLFSAAIGSGTGDDERVHDTLTQKNYLVLSPRAGAGAVTALAGPINDCPYAFRRSMITKLVRTGKDKAPYRPVIISRKVGAVNQESVVLATDQSGVDALYFLSDNGPYRLSSTDGLQWMGNDIADVWKQVSRKRLAGEAHGCFFPELNQIWWWLPCSGTNPYYNEDFSNFQFIVVFDTTLGRTSVKGVTGGWSIVGHRTITRATCSATFPYSYSGTAGAYTDRPSPIFYAIGVFGQGISCMASPADGHPVNDFDTVGAAPPLGYWARLDTKAIAPAGLEKKVGIIDGQLVATPGGSLWVQVTRDFSAESRGVNVPMTVETPGQSRIVKKVEDLSLAGATYVQVTFQDAESTPWHLEAFSMRFSREEDR